MTKSTIHKRIRSKYSHPCDGCSLRKVKCTGGDPCLRCAKYSIICTNNRKLKKCGPKNLRPRTIQGLRLLSESKDEDSPSQAQKNSQGHIESNQETEVNPSRDNSTQLSFIIEQLLPCLNIYQACFYTVWPVISSTQIISQLVDISKDESLMKVDESNAACYCLCCAIAATMARQASFLTPHSTLMRIPHKADDNVIIRECLRVRTLHDIHKNPSIDALLTSFFLYTYYANTKDGSSTSVMYLREALAIAQIRGMHEQSTYWDKSPAEVHRLRKIYYMLLVTERFMCIESKFPVILDASIPYPSLEYEEYPTLLHGFIELVKIFAIPDKRFFDKMLSSNQPSQTPFGGMLQHAIPISHSWLIKVQNELRSIQVIPQTPINQRLNILVSKYWMKSLTWSICKRNNLLTQNTDKSDECLNFSYPVQIAREFLDFTEHIPLVAFESNGPGVCVKLIEIANGLIDVIHNSKSDEAFRLLNKLVSLISRLENEITVPTKLYRNYARSVNEQLMQRFMDVSITELDNQEPSSIIESDMASSPGRWITKNSSDQRFTVPSSSTDYDFSKGDSNYSEVSNIYRFFE